MQIVATITIDGILNTTQLIDATVSIADIKTGNLVTKRQRVYFLIWGDGPWYTCQVALPRPQDEIGRLCPRSCFTRCNNSVEVETSSAMEEDRFCSERSAVCLAMH